MLEEDFEFKDWLTGFFEGDGTCFLTDVVSPKNGKSYTRTIITFTQKELQILEFIRDLLGIGSLYLAGRGPCWNLKCSSHKQCRVLLNIFREHLVMERSVERANKLFEFLGIAKAKQSLPSIDWITGFWDAEGFSSIVKREYEAKNGYKQYKNIVIGISQKNKEVLSTILEFYGVGRIYTNKRGVSEWRISGKDATEFSDVLLESSQNVSKKMKLIKDLEEVKCSK